VADSLIVLDGSTFFVSDPSGDLDVTNAGPTGVTGFFHSDVRHLTRWSLLVNGEPMRILTARNIDYYSARMSGTLASVDGGGSPRIGIRRERIVADGIHEDVWLENNSGQQMLLDVELRFTADFADLLEVKQRRDKQGTTWVEVDGQRVTLWYEHERYRRGTRIAFEAPGSLHGDAMRWRVPLRPREQWQTCVDVCVVVDGQEIGPRTGHGGMGKLHPNMPLSLSEWVADAPVLETDFDPLRHTYQQSLVNLAALRFRPGDELEFSLPAAGLPWFMAVFGRDSLITAYQSLPFHATLAKSTLQALAALQATTHDDFRDAEPGKILHELRRGELTSLGEAPHTPYYGTHDATPLFLILLDEYERWTADTALVHELEDAARDALGWIEGPGDPDGDGYLEYRTRSSMGLRSQCWKDSWNSILFADGRLAEPPIATCEIQGYAYDARLRTARLARQVWGDGELADRLEGDAAALRERFNRDFWIKERGHYALALDGDKRPVDTLTSNIGHLLWSGILDQRRARLVVDRLMGDDMWSGWGIRTMSTRAGGYDPIEYHNGTVWPHDTALIAEGMRRYGFRAEAGILVGALLDAAACFDYLLPEVFAGYARDERSLPVQYPTASRPQAWATGAPLLGLRTLLGMDVDDGGLTAAPAVPAGMGRVRLTDVLVRGQRRSIP
jgi:glycogen debranching enzyme